MVEPFQDTIKGLLSFPFSIHSCFVIRLTSPGVGAELTGALIPTCTGEEGASIPIF